MGRRFLPPTTAWPTLPTPALHAWICRSSWKRPGSSADLDADTFAGRLAQLRVVPVVTIDDAADAAGLAGALADGGLPIAEITFRTDSAAEAIAAIRAARPDVLVGAGTVLDPATVDRALEAGAHFIVAPGFNPVTVAYAQARGAPVVPGVVTPSEI